MHKMYLFLLCTKRTRPKIRDESESYEGIVAL